MKNEQLFINFIKKQQSQLYLALILILIFIVRLTTILVLRHTPCMENDYLIEGLDILSGRESSMRVSPTYSILVAILFNITGSLFVSSLLIFVVFSVLMAWYVYNWVLNNFGHSSAIIALIFLCFLPNTSIAVAGYSHTIVASTAMELGLLLSISNYLHIKGNKQLCFSLIYGLLCIALRPENIIVVFAIVSLVSIILQIKKFNQQAIKLFFSFVLVLICFLWMHKELVSIWGKKDQNLGIFSNNSYSYMTFIHTYSLRYSDVIEDTKAINYSTPFVGSPESNNFSLTKAIRNNPKQFVSNIFYTAKETLDSFGHPLFMPFFLYFFIGGVFIGSFPHKNYRISIGLLVTLMLAQLVPILIFHCEIRYLQPISIALVILSAIGFQKVYPKYKMYILGTVTVATVIIYLIYLINNSQLDSLCG